MKKSKREIVIILALIAGAVLFKVVLSLVTTNLGPSSAVNTTGLPVQSGHVTILISNREYQPVTVVVTAGTTVTWVNHDPLAHNVTEGHNATATSRGFHSGILSSQQSWSYVFGTPGTYEYTCTFHPDMNGHVVVKSS